LTSAPTASGWPGQLTSRHPAHLRRGCGEEVVDPAPRHAHDAADLAGGALLPVPEPEVEPDGFALARGQAGLAQQALNRVGVVGVGRAALIRGLHLLRLVVERQLGQSAVAAEAERGPDAVLDALVGEGAERASTGRIELT
jgi:hypothetical protein